MFIASEAFVDAAAAQARSLGLSPPGVYVPHPIQDRTDEEMQAMAESVADRVVQALLAP